MKDIFPDRHAGNSILPTPGSWDNKVLSMGQDSTDGNWLTIDYSQPLLLFPMPVSKSEMSIFFFFFFYFDEDRYVLAEVDGTF